MSESSKPAKTFRAGQIEVAVWSGEYGPSITVSKSYKDKTGEWKRTNFLNLGDIVIASKLLEKTIDYTMSMDRKPAQHQQPDSEGEPF